VAVLDLEGIEGLQQKLATMPAGVLAAAAQAIYEEATRIMAASQPLVPVDTGLLKSTGRVETESAPGPESVVKLSYGGNGLAPYAAVVHFRTDVHHPVGQAFYLQQPFFEATQGMAERLAAAIRQHLGGV
jgi:hypothetical protein